LSYETYDERHIPQRLRRPWSGQGYGEGVWTNRPDHNRFYPEIAVPLELAAPFTIRATQNQSVWCDLYIPAAAPAGLYTGIVRVLKNDIAATNLPVELRVRKFTLPDRPSAKTMVFLGYRDINKRYLNDPWPADGTSNSALSRLIRDRHFVLAHRHKVSLIDANEGAEEWSRDATRDDWRPRLDGSLFSTAQGYAGPGENVGNLLIAMVYVRPLVWPERCPFFSFRPIKTFRYETIIFVPGAMDISILFLIQFAQSCHRFTPWKE
jgi:hypothetical protein